MTRTKPHTVRTNGIAVRLVKQIGGDWGYTLPSGRRIVQIRDEHTGRGRGFDFAGNRYPTLIDACVDSGEMQREERDVKSDEADRRERQRRAVLNAESVGMIDTAAGTYVEPIDRARMQREDQ